MMAPLYCLRGTEEGVRFFETTLKEMEEKVRMGTGPLPEERFRFVIEGPPPWPYLRTFRDLFSKWAEHHLDARNDTRPILPYLSALRIQP